MKKLSRFLSPILFLLLNFSQNQVNAQTISPVFFGQNAWMPDTIGNASACIQPPCVLYGQLHNKWKQIAESGTSLVRFGGIQVDRNMPTNYQYIKAIDSIRARGMEPIIQVPFYNGRYSATQAAQIVQYINVTKGKAIKYWIIGNEPDHVYGYTSASQVAAYIKPFSSAMKAVDPNILIIGPETAWFNTNIMNGLTNPGGPDDITGTDASGRYYVDILSFHMYAFDGSQNRASMLTRLTASGGMEPNLQYLNNRIATCNTFHNRTGAAKIKSAVTEANVNWQNPSTDNLNGTGVNSFIGGQFIAEMFGVGLKNNVDFINMWSVVEGNTNALNIGYIDGPTGNKKPAYYHFQMMSKHFDGNLISSVSTQTNVKVFACKNATATTVLVLNEDLLTNHNLTVRLDQSPVTGTNSLKLNVQANIAQEYNDLVPNQSTMLLQFDNNGQLIKKMTYGLTSHATLNLAPTTLTFAPVVAAINAPTNTTPSNNLSRCTGKTATLTASSGTNTITWYSSLTSTSAVATGSVLVTPSLNAQSNSITVTYYAQANNSATVSLRTPVTVTVHPRPAISITSGSICAGESITLTPGGASTYTISGGSFVVSPLSTTAYYVSGTNSLGCTATISAVANVTVSPRPSVAVNSGSICSGSSFTITPTGAASYSFSSGSAVVSPVSNTSYSVWGNTGACSSLTAAIVNVSVSSKPVIAVNSASICPGASFVMNPTGASSYSFSNGTATDTPIASTTYTVIGFNADGCQSDAVVSTVTVYSAPVLAVNSGSICPGNSFSMVPSGASTYTFSGGSPVVTPVSTSQYTVSGTESVCGIVSTVISTVVVNANPMISINSGSICQGAPFVFAPTGAASYTILNASNLTVYPQVNTTYTVTGTSVAGCQGVGTATVVVQPNPIVSVNSGAICKGKTFVMQPSGAQTYSYSSGTPVVSPFITTSYTVYGTTKGCTGQAVSVVTVLKSSKCRDVYPVVSQPAPVLNDPTIVLAAKSDSLENQSPEEVLTGLQENKPQTILSVYPNPNNGEFIVDLNDAARLNIFDAAGNLRASSEAVSGKNLVQLTGLPAGMYILNVENTTGVETFKIIKQ